MRISGVTLPNNKHLEIALTEVYGIGRNSAQKILKSLSIPFDKKPSDLTETEEGEIQKAIKEYVIEGDLRREISSNIKRLKDISCYRGKRHSVRLPVRGQRTKTNARTRKGKRRTMGSGRVKLQKK